MDSGGCGQNADSAQLCRLFAGGRRTPLAEVLNLGAFDLLLGGPFDPEEVLRVVENAWWASEGNAKYASPLNRRLPKRAEATNLKKLVAGGGL